MRQRTVAGLSCVVLLGLSAPAAEARTCADFGGTTLLSSSTGRVFASGDRAYACRHQRPRRFLLTDDRRRARLFRLRGIYAAFVNDRRVLADGTTDGPGVVVVSLCDPRNSLFATVQTGGARVRDLELAPDGGAAWIASGGGLPVPEVERLDFSDQLPFSHWSHVDHGSRVRDLSYSRGRFTWRGGRVNSTRSLGRGATRCA